MMGIGSSSKKPTASNDVMKASGADPAIVEDPSPVSILTKKPGADPNIANTEPIIHDGPIFDSDPATDMLLLGSPIDIANRGPESGPDERFRFPDEEPGDYYQDDEYFTFSPSDGGVSARHTKAAEKGKTKQSIVVSHQTSHIVTHSPRTYTGGQMLKEMMLNPATMRRHLEITLKKLSVAVREKESLRLQLDATGMAAELDRVHSLMAEQATAMETFMKDYKSLQKTVRTQSRQVAELSRREKERDGAPDSLAATHQNNALHLEKQVAASNEKVRKLLYQYNSSRSRERHMAEQCSELKSQCAKLRAYIARLVKMQAFDESPKPVKHVQHNNVDHHHTQALVPGKKKGQKVMDEWLFSGEVVHAPYGVPDDRWLELGMNDATENCIVEEGEYQEKERDFSIGSENATVDCSLAALKSLSVRLATDTSPEAAANLQLQGMVKQLHKNLAVQSANFQRDAQSLRSEVSRLSEENRKLQGEIDDCGRDARSHILTINQLREAYDSILSAHQRMVRATDAYSNNPPSSSLTGRSDAVTVGSVASSLETLSPSGPELRIKVPKNAHTHSAHQPHPPSVIKKSPRNQLSAETSGVRRIL